MFRLKNILEHIVSLLGKDVSMKDILKCDKKINFGDKINVDENF